MSYGNFFCDMPFISLSVGSEKAHFCCYAKVKYTSINISDRDSIADIYNHPTIVEARGHMYTGKYDKVCRLQCPHYSKGGVKNTLLRSCLESDSLKETLQLRDLSPEQTENIRKIGKAIHNKKSKIDALPYQVAFILENRGCNIYCYYCSHVLNTKNYRKENPAKLEYQGKHSRQLIENAKHTVKYLHTISFGGSEPTLYPEYDLITDFLLDYPKVKLSLCTNGMLIDEKRAKRILKQNFTWVRFSMDAATEKTFKIVRRGADWKKVTETIRYFTSSRPKGKFPKIQINFVVTMDNYKEIVDFAHLAQELGCDGVHYKILIRDEIPFEFRQHIPYVKAFTDKLIAMDPKDNKDVCKVILEEMSKVDYLVKKYGLMMPNDAVRPAIYVKYPEIKTSNRVSAVIT